MLAKGARLGPYEILEQIGEGGMGAVYRARDPRLNRDVAIKVLRADVVADPDRRARFVHEARAVSALNHPNIVTVHDIGTEGDVTYMVMELVDGRPLDQLVGRGALRVADVLRIGAQIADACSRAHAQHIIHRDLKPANVMVQSDGRVKVLDFGLAKLADAAAERDPASATRTAAGVILGTVAYMSPEQAEGKTVDERSDIFSLGAVLYEMCTGARVFAGDSTATVLANVLREDPPSPASIRADVPSELARLILRCLKKDPARRVQSAGDLKVALEELKDEVDSGRLSGAVSAPTAAATRRAPWLIVGAAIVVAGLAVAAAITWRARTPSSGVQDELRATPLTGYTAEERAGSFSPDGNQIVFTWGGPQGDNNDIYVKLINVEPPLRLTTDPRQDFRPRWSPDGRQIAFLRILGEGEVAVVLVSPLGGPERKVAQVHSVVDNGSWLASAAWTPDSRSLFVTGARSPGAASDLWRLSIDTGELRQVRAAGAKELGYGTLAFSPDGRTLAAGRYTTEGRWIELLTLSDAFEPRDATKLSAITSPVQFFAWTGDSREIVYSVAVNNPESLYRVAVSGGPPTIMAWTGAGAVEPVVSRDGNRMVFTRVARDANIWRLPLDHKGAPQQIASSSFRDVAPLYSPDGKRLAFYSNRSGSVQIWTADADGNRSVQLTSMPPHATTGTPRWSPDGLQIVFDSNAPGQYQIYVIGVDGGSPKQLTSGSANFVGSWSRDGQWIYFTSDRSGRNEIWRMSPDGTGTEQVTRNGGEGSMISADGQWLYFTKANGANGLWRLPAAGGAESRVVDGVYRYDYAATTGGVYFVAPLAADGTSTIRYKDFKTGAISDHLKTDKPVDLGLAVSPDGRWLLFATLDYVGADLMFVDHFR